MQSALVLLLGAIGLAAAVHESYHGVGSMVCYGDMSISIRSQDDQGFLICQPAWGSAAAPPQVT